MTNTDIKKLYTKTKKAYEKRTGNKLTWVMNAKQQALGTATICTGSAWDTEMRLISATKYAEEKAAKDATKTWKAFEREAKAEELSGGSSWDPTFWRRPFKEMGTLDEYIADKVVKAWEVVHCLENELRTRGDQMAVAAANAQEAQEIIDGPEISSFLKAIGGRAIVEEKNEGDGILTYIRFFYTASEANA